MASAIDEVLSAAEFLEVDLCCVAIAAAELCACCAGQLPAARQRLSLRSGESSPAARR
jgi:hypothetical protein